MEISDTIFKAGKIKKKDKLPKILEVYQTEKGLLIVHSKGEFLVEVK